MPAPNLLNETFEGTGYVAMTGAETIGAGSSLDEDYATSNVGSPAGWEAQCLRAISVITTPNAFKQHTFGSPLTGNIFVRDEIIWVTEGLANSGANHIHDAYTTGFAATPFRLIVQQSAGGVLQFMLLVNHAGSNDFFIADVTPVLNTKYVVEINYNIPGDTWEWRIDSVTQDSGTLTATHPTEVAIIRVGSGGSSSNQAIEIVHDNVGYSDADWLGPAVITQSKGGIRFPEGGSW